MPIQQMMLGAGGPAAEKTYVDDVYSTMLYEGNGGFRSVPCELNFSDGGGMVWTKCRSHAGNHQIWDTVRGVHKRLRPDADDQSGNEQNSLTSFSNGAFALGSDGDSNRNGRDYSSWSFKRAKGFLDIVEYSGDSSTDRSIAHNLGCEPGTIIIKRTDESADWAVWHRDLETLTGFLNLNTADMDSKNVNCFNTANITSTHFSVNANYGVTNSNQSGATYIAYLFAGGFLDSYLARSILFDGSDDYIRIGTSSDFAFGTGDFTIEAWINPADSEGGVIYDDLDGGNTGTVLYIGSDGLVRVNTAYWRTAEVVPSIYKLALGSWTHVAYTCQGSTNKIFINGTLAKTWTNSLTRTAPTNYVYIGRYSPSASNAMYFNGKISTLRVVKGTAVYTSSFKVPTEPLTNITNTVLLCCNNGNNDQSASGSTVAPSGSSFSAYGGATLKKDCPFDDPASFIFGDGGDQNIIKCGSYTTDDSEDANVYLGWEPQWIMVKRTDSNSAADWMIVDHIRGFPSSIYVRDNSGSMCNVLEANTTDAENSTNRLGITSTGFYADQFGANRDFIYIAIRRDDPYVAKPIDNTYYLFRSIETRGGTQSNPNSPAYSVQSIRNNADFFLTKIWWNISYWNDWKVCVKLAGNKFPEINTDQPNANIDHTGSGTWKWDFNDGFATGPIFQDNTHSNKNRNAWAWKRTAGFDTVVYRGNGDTSLDVPHNLSQTPEFIWIKRLEEYESWSVYHKGLNGGTNPEQKYLQLNTDTEESDASDRWNDTAPTSTHFTVGNSDTVNASNTANYLALLFASVNGMSKVGYFDGQSSNITITLGFSPQFLILKKVSGSGDWLVLQTKTHPYNNPWPSSSNETTCRVLRLNHAEETENYDISYRTSTGFVLTNDTKWNDDGEKYIYYAQR